MPYWIPIKDFTFTKNPHSKLVQMMSLSASNLQPSQPQKNRNDANSRDKIEEIVFLWQFQIIYESWEVSTFACQWPDEKKSLLSSWNGFSRLGHQKLNLAADWRLCKANCGESKKKIELIRTKMWKNQQLPLNYIFSLHPTYKFMWIKGAVCQNGCNFNQIFIHFLFKEM